MTLLARIAAMARGAHGHGAPARPKPGAGAPLPRVPLEPPPDLPVHDPSRPHGAALPMQPPAPPPDTPVDPAPTDPPVEAAPSPEPAPQNDPPRTTEVTPAPEAMPASSAEARSPEPENPERGAWRLDVAPREPRPDRPAVHRSAAAPADRARLDPPDRSVPSRSDRPPGPPVVLPADPMEPDDLAPEQLRAGLPAPPPAPTPAHAAMPAEVPSGWPDRSEPPAAAGPATLKIGRIDVQVVPPAEPPPPKPRRTPPDGPSIASQLRRAGVARI